MTLLVKNREHHVKVKSIVLQLHDGAAPPSSAYKADVIAGILMEHKIFYKVLP